MKVWLMYGVDLQEGIPYDTLLGVFAEKELMMDYRKHEEVDSKYAYIEYSEHVIIED